MKQTIALVVCLISLTNALKYNGGALNNLRGARSHLYEASGKGLPAQWFANRVNHFDLQSTETYKQKYFINSEFYQSGGPVFFILGGEGPLSDWYLTGTMFAQYARATNGMVVALEHRFYGDSFPAADMSVESLKLLSADQALADAAFFKEALAKDMPDLGPWIVCGGSYSGALSSWARIKYSNLFFGSIASSAPVEAMLDFAGYLEVTAASLQTAGGFGGNCMAYTSKVLLDIQDKLQTSSGRDEIRKTFNLCSSPDPFASELDIQNFMSDVIGVFQGAVQYNSVNLPVNITVVCNAVAGPNPIGALANLTISSNSLTPAGCLDASYATMIKQLKDTSKTGAVVGGRAWLYQTCTAFAYFQTTNTPRGSWGNLLPLSYYSSICNDAYNGVFTVANGGIEWTNTKYGGQNAPALPGRIIYPNGSLDPWHFLSIFKQNPGPNEFALFINGTSHCQDWDPAGPNDPPGLAAAQKAILTIVQQWLQQAALESTLRSSKISEKTRPLLF